VAPRTLSQSEIDAFRAELCRVATRRFAEEGFAGVTMRGLAAEMGCSPMTPYRYFRNKEHIFAAVRAAAAMQFADEIRAAASAQRRPLDQLRAIGDAYVHFADKQPDSFRIMFQLDQPDASDYPDVVRQNLRAWEPLRDAVAGAIRDGSLAGDVVTVAHLFWSGLHGLVTLHLAGRLRMGHALDDLVAPMWESLVQGMAPAPPESHS
jgi:AcrR family transcriptional regulator